MTEEDQNNGSGMSKCCIRTETNIKMFEIRSTVENVSKLPLETKLTGPDFDLTSECVCCVSFEKNKFFLFVYIRNKSAAEIQMVRTLNLYDCKNFKLHEESDEKIYSLKKDENVDIIGRINNRSSYDSLTNDTLIIDICINIREIIGRKSICFATIERKLREDLKVMLKNPVNSDVSLQVGEERIPAHWSILCSRSLYFKRMFESNMKERVENSIIITDLSFCTLKKLVEFLYTAHFSESHKVGNIEDLIELYYAADKYDVIDLRALCACIIMKNASADNVWQIFLLAHRHSDKDLKMEALNYIQLNSGSVLQTEGWEKFKASEPLTAEAFSFF